MVGLEYRTSTTGWRGGIPSPRQTSSPPNPASAPATYLTILDSSTYCMSCLKSGSPPLSVSYTACRQVSRTRLFPLTTTAPAGPVSLSSDADSPLDAAMWDVCPRRHTNVSSRTLPYPTLLYFEVRCGVVWCMYRGTKGGDRNRSRSGANE